MAVHIVDVSMTSGQAQNLLTDQNIMKRTFRSFIGASSVISGDFTETAAARPVLA